MSRVSEPPIFISFILQTGYALFIVRFINMHIRQDAENQLRLRSRMRVGDVGCINYTGKNIDTRISTKDSAEKWIEIYKKTLKEKVNRESVYAT
jgi:hypothetical protein